jgi:hypothetical protein
MAEIARPAINRNRNRRKWGTGKASHTNLFDFRLGEVMVGFTAR